MGERKTENQIKLFLTIKRQRKRIKLINLSNKRLKVQKYKTNFINFVENIR